VLRFSQQQVNVAHRYENQQQAKASGRNLRSAVEATVRSVKHPFRNGKLPVRGKRRVSMMMVASAAMTNVRRIWRCQVAKRAAENAQIVGNPAPKQAAPFVFQAFLRLFFCSVSTQSRYCPVAA
jgi:hypothetical protein